MKLIIFLYGGVLGVTILAIGVHYIHARVAERRAKRERARIRTRLLRVNTTAEDLSRIQPIIDAGLLKQCRVGLYGAGSLGSWLARFLSPWVGEIRVVDADTVDASNIAGGRTIYSAKHLGMAKPRALKQVLENDVRHLRVLAHTEDINDLSDWFLEDLLDGEVVICAVDDIQSILRLNRVFYGRQPLVYGGFMRQAADGFICVVTRDTPCFECCLQLLAEEFRPLNREPGLGLDISTIAHYMARITVAMLDDSGGDFSQEIRDAVRAGNNILHISNRTRLGSRRASPEPFSLTWLAPERRLRCGICE